MTMLIAEVKTQSPWGYSSELSWMELFKIAEKAGQMIAVHTDPRWGGSLDLVRKARGLTEKPILAKGVHRTDEELLAAFDAGADLALVVGRVPPLRLLARCLVEPSSITQLKELPRFARAVWNMRDVRDGEARALESFGYARKGWGGWLCQASYVRSIYDIQPGADAVLVGEHLVSYVNDRERGRL